MTKLHLIESLMTFAFLLYLFAFFLKNNKHKLIAVIAFSLDLYGTFLMGEMKGWIFFPYPLFTLQNLHALFSLLAVLAFFVQVYFGISKNIDKHKRFAIYLFFPIWILSFITGAFMVHG